MVGGRDSRSGQHRRGWGGGRGGVAAVRGQSPGGSGHVGGQPGHRGLPGLDPLGQDLAQLGDPGAGAPGGGDQPHVPQPVGDEQPAQVGQTGRALGGPQPVDLVERDQHDAGVAGQRAQVALVHGGIGVLLRVQHPDQQVDQLD